MASTPHPLVRIELFDQYEEFLGGFELGDPRGATPNPRYDQERLAARDAIHRLTSEAAKAGAQTSVGKEREELRVQRYDGARTFAVLEHWSVTCGSLAVALAVLRSILPYIREVLKYKSGQWIKVEAGDTKITMTGSNDVDKLLPLLHELEKQRTSGNQSILAADRESEETGRSNNTVEEKEES
jgi:hypothetical protein